MRITARDHREAKVSTDSTRTRLLAAAERILVEQGVNALSVRRVGEGAGQNPALVTYHFKSLYNLLDELCGINLEPMLDAWSGIRTDRGLTTDEVLVQWLEPLLRPAAFTPNGRALAVLDGLAAHGEAALKERVLRSMEEFSLRLRAALAPSLPHLSDDEIRARVRFISGAALGPPPRSNTTPLGKGAIRLDDMSYLLPFARAALSLPPQQ